MAFKVREEELELWKGAEGFTILHLSDIHIWISKRLLENIKAAIIQQDPDLLVLTGDYYDTLSGARLFHDFLSEIALSYKIVFIRGNHDFIYGRKNADKLLSIPNCYCVENEVYCFVSNQGFTYNITSWDNRNQLQEHIDARNILLIHNPEKLKEKELPGIDLVLAGHLHGGQFIFWKSRKGAHFPGCLAYRYCTDRKQIDNTTVIISKGLGDTFPVRINCDKEIVRIKIS